ncbi:MAG: T9SS type A sorting domain-containing protein [Candidatus Zixiibacteriota bacterium]
MNMKTILKIAICLIIVLFGFHIATAADNVYPTSYDISCNYVISSDMVAISDTFTISRTLVNNESFNLSGLYYSDNLPSAFAIVAQNITINGNPVSFVSASPLENHIVEGYNGYYWIVDSPDGSEGVSNIIEPGDVVNMQLKVICNSVGNYLLPIHTAVFYGNNVGLFATSDSLEIEVVLSLDVDDDIPETMPGTALISKAYPNPFNSTVTIQYSGLGVAGNKMTLALFDIAGRKILENEFVAPDNNGYIKWESNETISSGVYFYKLTDGSHISGGKLILLK